MLKDKWKDLQDAVEGILGSGDDISVEHLNLIANELIKSQSDIENNKKYKANKTDIPTKVSQLLNDKEYTTKKDVEDVIKETKAEANQMYANALKGYASGNVININDVSPVPHTVKTNVHSKNIFNINDVYGSSYLDYRVEDNKLIVKKTNTQNGKFSNIFFNIGTCKNFSNKALTLSITNESNMLFSVHLVYFVNGVMVTEPFVRGGSLIANKTTTFTRTVPDNNIEEMMCLRIVSQDSTITGDEEYTLSNIQVEYGTEATPYKPYVNVEDITVKVCGANLFDVFNETYEQVFQRARKEVFEDGTLRIISKVATSQVAHRAIIPMDRFEVGDFYVSARVQCGIEGANPGISVTFYNSADGGGEVGQKSTFVTNPFSPVEITVKGTITESIKSKYDTVRIYFYISQNSTKVVSVGDYADYSNIMISTSDVPYEPYESETYTPNEDGKLEINSISPIMNILSDTPNVVINAEYNKDINKAFEEIQQAIISMGGNV